MALGIAGYDFSIDENGDTQGNYTLLSRQLVATAGRLEPNLQYNLSSAMFPTAMFGMGSSVQHLPVWLSCLKIRNRLPRNIFIF